MIRFSMFMKIVRTIQFENGLPIICTLNYTVHIVLRNNICAMFKIHQTALRGYDKFERRIYYTPQKKKLSVWNLT